MRPDVAVAFDRMAAAARAAGVALVINSAYRSDAEQQRLWDANPDPRWVAPPGTSLHRCGTELDLGLVGRLRLAGRERRPVRLRPALLLGGLALRLRRTARRRARRRATGSPRPAPSPTAGAAEGPGCPASCRRASGRRCWRPPSRHDVSAALLAAQLMAESELQPERGLARRRAGHRAVHAGDGRRLRAPRPVRPGRGDRRAGAADGASCSGSSARSSSRSPPTTPARERCRRATACRPTRRRRPTSPGSSALLDGAGQLLGGPPALEVRLVA